MQKLDIFSFPFLWFKLIIKPFNLHLILNNYLYLRCATWYYDIHSEIITAGKLFNIISFIVTAFCVWWVRMKSNAPLLACLQCSIQCVQLLSVVIVPIRLISRHIPNFEIMQKDINYNPLPLSKNNHC